MSSDRGRVLIVGGGFSGAMTAVRLLARTDGPAVVLIEPDHALPRGPAYGCASERRLLNVHAGAMSAFAERPLDFVEFAAGRRPDVGPKDYLPRPLYGDYLARTLDAAIAAADRGRFQRIAATARTAEMRKGAETGFTIETDQGPVSGDALVVCTGAPGAKLPRCWPADAADDPRFVADSRRRAFGPEDALDLVLVIGTGLTMIDVALDVAAASRTAGILALSRRGLLPEAHTESPASPIDPSTWDARALIGLPAGEVVRRIKAALVGAGPDWRNVIAALRPVTNDLWRSFSVDGRNVMLRRWFSRWNVVRHRTAPTADDVLVTLRAAERLELARGTLVALERTPRGAPLRAVFRDRAGRLRELRPTLCVNATGPDFDVANAPSSFPAALIRTGLAAPGPLGLGLDVLSNGAMVGPDGRPTKGAYVVGPLRFGAEFETSAVPELRVQAATAAEAVARDLGMAAAQRT